MTMGELLPHELGRLCCPIATALLYRILCMTPVRRMRAWTLTLSSALLPVHRLLAH